jgi:ABC-2 type transport system ATP-binding protein
VVELKDIKRHTITITFATTVPAEAFERLDGVTEVERLADGRTLRLVLQGGADAVIKAAAQYAVVTLSSHEPSLEDIFLRYYERPGQAVAGTEAEARHVV